MACRLLQPRHRLERISILPASNGAAGYNLSIPEEKMLPTRESLCAQLQVLLAGRAAEQLLAGDNQLSAGATDDLTRATELASAMVLDLGLIGHPAVSLRTLAKSTNALSGEAGALITRRLADCYQAVTQLLSNNATLLETLSKQLLRSEALNASEIDAFFAEHLAA